MTGLEIIALCWLLGPKESYADEKARAADVAAAKAQAATTKTPKKKEGPPSDACIIFWGLACLLSVCAIAADAYTGWKIFFLVTSGWSLLYFGFKRLSN